jgi:hypothetical protein
MEIEIVLTWEASGCSAQIGEYGDRDTQGHPARISLWRPTALESLLDALRKLRASRPSPAILTTPPPL